MAEIKENGKEAAIAVQRLYVMMTKKGILPEYELLYDGQENGDGVFIYQVVCGEYVTKGSGRTKKEAKKNAAIMMLNQIKQNDERIMQQGGDKSKPEAWWARMPVHALQVICAREELPHPDYQELERTGPHHAALFTTNCIVSPFERRGEGGSKKSSKQDAAKKMIILLSEKNESVKELIEELSKSTFQRLEDPEKIDSVDSSVIGSSSDSISSEKCEDRGKIVPSKHAQSQPNINELLNGMNTSVINQSKLPPEQINTSSSNLNKLVDKMNTLDMKKSPELSNKKLKWPPGYLLCQRRSVTRKLQNLCTALKQHNVNKTEEFEKEFENILRLFDVVPNQIIQKTHDDKFLMAIYVPTDPMIVDTAVDVDEVNLKIVVYQRVVETLLNMI